MRNKNDFKANLFYSDEPFNDIYLPETLEAFKLTIKELYNIDSKLNNEICITYILSGKENNKDIETKIEVKTEDEYKNMRNIIADEIKGKNINIEIKNNLNIINKKKPETFEEEIQFVVETELKNAAERIKNCLSSKNKKIYPETITQDKTCKECGEFIKGNIYKKVLEVKEFFYCEKCSSDINEPMFIFH